MVYRRVSSFVCLPNDVIPFDFSWLTFVPSCPESNRSLGDTKDPVSNYFDEQYDKVFDMALLTKELPNIMWGRIDYMTVTRLTSEWMIWKYVGCT